MISKVLRHLLFLPSITFGAISSEIFPWAAIYSILHSKFKKTNFTYIFICFYVIFNILISIYFFETPIGKIFSTLFAYLNPTLIFLLIISIKHQHIKKVVSALKNVFFFLLFFGFLQTLNLTAFLENIYSFLIPRGNFKSMIDSGRGVALLSTEPSRAALEVVFLALLIKKTFLKKQLYFDIFIVIYVNFIIQGGYALLYSSIYFLFSLPRKSLVAVVPLFSVAVVFFIEKITNLRGYYIINRLFETNTFLETLVQLSGFRVLSFIAGVKYAILNPFGGGFGNWEVSSLTALNLTKFDPSTIPHFIYKSEGFWHPIKPTSIFGNMLLDFGLFGTIILLISMMFIVRSRVTIVKKHIDIYVAFFVYFFLFGYLGNPIPPIVFALCLNKNMILKPNG
jgi:hypothetical protein